MDTATEVTSTGDTAWCEGLATAIEETAAACDALPRTGWVRDELWNQLTTALRAEAERLRSSSAAATTRECARIRDLLAAVDACLQSSSADDCSALESFWRDLGGSG